MLSDNDKPLLSKGLNFSLPIKKIEILEYLCSFELLYREVSDFSNDSHDKELLKNKLKELGLSFHRSLKHNLLEENLSKKEFESLNNLNKNANIIIQKSVKGSFLDKKVYLEKMNEMLNKKEQFLKLSIQEEKHYNFLINLQKKIFEPLQELYQLDTMDKKTYDKLCPVGPDFGFEFSRDILNQNPNLFMASLDVDSLFTNIPLDETTIIIIKNFLSEKETVHNLSKG